MAGQAYIGVTAIVFFNLMRSEKMRTVVKGYVKSRQGHKKFEHFLSKVLLHLGTDILKLSVHEMFSLLDDPNKVFPSEVENKVMPPDVAKLVLTLREIVNYDFEKLQPKPAVPQHTPPTADPTATTQANAA